jgi:hypothetical protein
VQPTEVQAWSFDFSIANEKATACGSSMEMEQRLTD